MSAAVAAARRLGVALTLDAPPEHVNPAWLRDIERTGNDWDIAVVGRCIADAVAPADMAPQLTTIVRKIHTEECP